MSWTNIDVLENQIKHSTDTMSLVKIPHSENKVWVPNKCIRSGKNRQALCIGINDEWQYRAIRAKTLRFEMSGNEIIDAFSKVNVKSKQFKILFEDHKPTIKKVSGIQDVDDELIR